MKKITLLFTMISLVILFTTDYVQEADAMKASGTPLMKYGSATAGVVCGDRLCSEENVDEKQIIVMESSAIPSQKEKYEKSSTIKLNPSFEFDKVANSFIVRLSGGELEKTLTFETFSRVEPGDKAHYIKSFYDLGFTTNFVLESLPSKDKLEFYQLVTKYLSIGKVPELFDVGIDIISGDGSKLVTVNYSKCGITGYTPHTQDLVFFYQYSEQTRDEIRDLTTIYCAGIDLEIYHEPDFIDGYLGNVIPNDMDRAQHYVVHFFGPDFEGLYTLNTFSKFSPSEDAIETPFDTITFPGNPLETSPQFFLESIPSKDKSLLYKIFSKHINLGPEPERFNVSIDMVTGDETILQRWNYVDCELTDYILHLEDSMLKFPFGEKPAAEIRDKSDISCIGLNLEVPEKWELSRSPIRALQSIQKQTETTSDTINQAKSFVLTVSGGELSKVYVDESIQKVETITRDRGPLTPLHHAKQYDFGFLMESIPTKDRVITYEFLAQYVNLGKDPEPFDVSIDTILDDGSILHRIQYTNCDAVDFSWYLQDANFLYQFSNEQRQEIRERYINYCEGIKIEFP
jgi:hypothetical protein